MTIRIIAGSLKGRLLKTPKTGKTRPITSYLKKSMFDTCQPWIDSARILDLFAGSGAIGIEGISRGAAFCLFIDLDEGAVRVIKENLRHLQIESFGIALKQDAFKWLVSYKGEPFDLLFIDPPYPIGKEGYENILSLLQKNRHLMTEESRIFLEMPGTLARELRPLLASQFTILKEKASSTTLLFFLKPLPSYFSS